jgi:hypothetical protein
MGGFMNKWARMMIQCLSGVFFLVGAMFLPFGVGLSGSQGSNPIVGWLIFLASVGIPWAIAVALARVSLRRYED